jgi:hypothetical protein
VAVQERIDARKRAQGATLARRTPEPATRPQSPVANRKRTEAPTTNTRRTSTPAPERKLAAVAALPPVASQPPASPAARADAGLDPLRTVLVPDFRGETLAGARRVAASESLEVRAHGPGSGRVVAQSPAAGSIVGGSDRTIILSLSSTREEG